MNAANPRVAFGVIAAPAAASDPNSEGVATAVSSSPSGSPIIDVARQYVGTPYVWGGATPTGFDCSGFTAAEARPGDLVWWPGHVSIYTGNGQNIAARNPSTLLHESPIWRADPTFIRVG